MLNASATPGTGSSLMGEYAALVADAVLRQRAREAEHAARVEAELASKVKSEFIANMSHELRTPLNTVIGFAKLIGECERRQLTGGQIVEYAGLIHDAATHLLAVINDILDISKMQSGKYTLDAREVAAAGDPAIFARGLRAERHRGRRVDREPLRSGRADGPGRSRQTAPGVQQPDQQRREIHAARRFGACQCKRTRRRRRNGPHPRYRRRHDEGRDRGRVDALRPGRCQSFPLARGRRPWPADRQGARAAARRQARDPQRQVARHRGGGHAAFAFRGIGHAGTRRRARIRRSTGRSRWIPCNTRSCRSSAQARLGDPSRCAERSDRPHRFGHRLQGHRHARGRARRRGQSHARAQTAPRDGHAVRHRHDQYGGACHRLGAERAGSGTARGRERAVDRRTRPGRRALEGCRRSRRVLQSRRVGLSRSRRPRAHRLPRGAGACLLRRQEKLRAGGLHPAGPIDLRHGFRRRSAGQALCHPGHDGHRQILHDGIDPARDPAEESGRAHGAARSAQRVCDRLRRMGRGDQPAQHAAALLAAQLRRADRGADQQSAGAQGRGGDPARVDPDGQEPLRLGPRQLRSRACAAPPT